VNPIKPDSCSKREPVEKETSMLLCARKWRELVATELF